ncbi:unnamed protein product [Psylliodes chrysocephalus]|uniref:Carbohydrate kinase FGGY N-terminal domain-containing protein n=1 Tax=Psylliodes chrysocephalus TaxID=3402493 RepID=A0A9P0CQ97_9CUCU|nr:unnamed protein product [Psylliodes chrysocephala]
MTAYFIGIDVGTGSVRAALVTDTGEIIKIGVKEIKTWNNQTDFYEQSTDDIWNAIITCIKSITEGVDPEKVIGIGFDATCSLACFDKSGAPLSVSPTGNNDQNVILWLDHRAVKEADEINNLKHPVLKYVGGKISPEMETPKLLWLKRNLKADCWDKAGYFFDLPDFLTWKATDADSRSSCSLVCKWTYEISETDCREGWNKSYFEQIGLDDLAANNWKKIGSLVLPPGTPVGNGLSQSAAAQFGLKAGTAVGASMIDAHAGGLGLIGCIADGIDPAFHTRLGTSKTIQNELLDSILHVCQDIIKKDIQAAKYIAIQDDETTGGTTQTQMVLIIRYVKDGRIYERFSSFLRPMDHTEDGLSAAILELFFFSKLMPNCDILFDQLQSRQLDALKDKVHFTLCLIYILI